MDGELAGVVKTFDETLNEVQPCVNSSKTSLASIFGNQ